MPAALLSAAVEVVAGAVLVLLGLVAEVVVDVAEVVEVVVETTVEVVVVLGRPEVDEEVDPVPVVELEPDVEEVVEDEFKHEVSLLDWMVKAADWAKAPVLSRRLRPIDVLGGRLTTHDLELPSTLPKSTRAGALGWLPGRMLKK